MSLIVRYSLHIINILVTRSFVNKYIVSMYTCNTLGPGALFDGFSIVTYVQDRKSKTERGLHLPARRKTCQKNSRDLQPHVR